MDMEKERREANALDEAVLKIQCAYRTKQAKRQMAARRADNEAKIAELRAAGMEESEIEALQEQ